MASILVRVELSSSRHGDRKGTEGVLNADRVPVIVEHLWQAPIDHGAFVHITAAQEDPLLTKPLVHLLTGKARRTDPLSCLILLPLGVHAAIEAARAMDCRIEAVCTLRAFDAVKNHSIVPH